MSARVLPPPAAVLAAALVVVVAARSPGQPDRALPPAVDRLLAATVTLNDTQRAKLLAGAPVTRLLDSDESREVAVLGVVWIDASPAQYVEALRQIETFERGEGFIATRRIGNPPRIEDFADMSLPDEDVEDLKRCRVGDCAIKLSAHAIERLRAEIDWSRPTAKADARAAFRRLVFEYVRGYLKEGNARLPIYRDKDRPTAVAEEFRLILDRMPLLASGLPELRRYLLEYPSGPPHTSADFLYWQQANFGLKPTIRISHVVVQENHEATVAVSKMLYASHYFWSALETRALLPDRTRGQGFWLVTVNRSRSDGLSGFTGFFVRRRVRGEVEKSTLALLHATKRKLESATAAAR